MIGMDQLLVESICIVAGILGVISWMQQLRRVWKEKKHEGISIPTFWLVAAALSLWLIYGFLMGSLAMILANIAALGCILALIIGVNRLRREG